MTVGRTTSGRRELRTPDEPLAETTSRGASAPDAKTPGCLSFERQPGVSISLYLELNLTVSDPTVYRMAASADLVAPGTGCAHNASPSARFVLLEPSQELDC